MPLRLSPLLLLALLISSCKQELPRIQSVGEAYVGPISLQVRQDLAPNSSVISTLKHGDHLDLLQSRRRFFRVRTPQGVEGWVDGRSLISTAQMNELRLLSENNRGTPSQGKAKNFELLNMHADATRGSPSFFQIQENSTFDVIGQRSTPRGVGETAVPQVLMAPKAPPRPRKKPGKEKAGPQLAIPPPPAPKVPENWRDLSYRKPVEEFPPDPEPEQKHGKKGREVVPVKIDDWCLIRTKDGKVGWVLSRMVQMLIPDDVAQYAEGRHITSYFLLEEVTLEDNKKKGHWLWTTVNHAGMPYQFDSFRVFIWNRRRARYETAYIERNVVGYYPTSVSKEELMVGKTKESAPVFAVLLKTDEGACYRKKFVFEVNRARFLGKEPAACPGDPETKKSPSIADTPLPTAPESDKVKPKSLTERLKEWKARLFGGNK